MRFIMLMIPGVYQYENRKNLKENYTPPVDIVRKMNNYNEQLVKSGALILLDGFHPIERGARVTFLDGKPIVTDGPFVETMEVVGGYWMVQFKSKKEAVEWAKRIPAQDGDIVEIRQVFENSEFPEEIRKELLNTIVQTGVEK